MIETWWIATAHKRRQVASNKLAITIAIFMEYVAFYWKTRSWEVPPSGIFTRDIRQELSSRALLAYFYWGYPNPRVDAKVWPTRPTNFGDMTTCSRTSPAFGCMATWGSQFDVQSIQLPSGKHTKSYWKWPFIVDFPIKHGDFPIRYVKLPEGIYPIRSH